MKKNIVFSIVLMVSVLLSSTISLEGQSGGRKVYGGSSRSTSSSRSGNSLDNINKEAKSIKSDIQALLAKDYHQYEPHHGSAYITKQSMERLSSQMDSIISISGERWEYSVEMAQYRQKMEDTKSSKDGAIVARDKRKKYVEEEKEAALNRFVSRVKSSLRTAYSSLNYSSISLSLGSIDYDIKSLGSLINN